MFPIEFGWQTVATVCFSLLCLYRRQQKGPAVAWATVYGDEDIRIAAAKASEEASTDFGQQEAEKYIHHRQNGNIEKARELGCQLGKMVLQDMPALESGIKDWILIDHAKMLYIFVAERAIRDLAPDAILSQVSVAAFRQEVTAKIEAVYEGLSGSRADTFYQLSYFRKPVSKVAHHMGKTFAQMCDREEEAVEVLGETMFTRMYEKCRIPCTQIQYAE